MALADSVILATDPGFQGRVLEEFIAQALAIVTAETEEAPLHNRRAPFAVQILNNPMAFQEMFAMACASDQSSGGIVYQATYVENGPQLALTTDNVKEQASHIQDSLITTWVTANFNAFFSHV
jgi:hypothetical protein